MRQKAKRIAKRMLSKFLYSWLVRIYEKIFIKTRPRFTSPLHKSSSILHCCIAYNKFGGYCVPISSRHRPAAQKILSGDVYEPQTIEFILSHINNGDIVHAGTYFGDFLPALSRSCQPKAKIWAFEPNGFMS